MRMGAVNQSGGGVDLEKASLRSDKRREWTEESWESQEIGCGERGNAKRTQDNSEGQEEKDGRACHRGQGRRRCQGAE